jgi:hypothetical protein
MRQAGRSGTTSKNWIMMEVLEAASVGGLFLVAYWQILLQKSFWGGEGKFSEPLMRFTRGV